MRPRRKRVISNTYLYKSVDYDKDYYEILGLESTASTDDVKKAYRNLAKKYHPDVNKSASSEEIFKLISEAYEILSDQAKRTRYDTYRKFMHEYESKGGEKSEASRAAAEDKARKAGAAESSRRGQDKARASGSARPAESPEVEARKADERNIFILSLIVPGFYQIYSGEKKFGYLLLAIYFAFWVLAFVQNLAIGTLAIFVWLYSVYDAYSSLKNSSSEGLVNEP